MTPEQKLESLKVQRLNLRDQLMKRDKQTEVLRDSIDFLTQLYQGMCMDFKD